MYILLLWYTCNQYSLKLTLFNVTLWTQGNYTIRVTNEIGSVFKTVSVIIEGMNHEIKPLIVDRCPKLISAVLMY